MQKIIYISFLLGTLNAYAFDYKIEALRGEVKLEKTGDLLKVNDELRIDDVVNTSEKSFVKIIYANGGRISVGPNSSIKLVKAKAQKISTLALLRGQLRANFDKKDNKDYKFLIKTKSAALGVRGTDFHIIYNPDNNVSTVLTYEGKVEFAENTSNDLMSEKEFEKHEKINIPPGYISGVFYNAAKASPPIKISPLQFAILDSNQELKEGTGQKIIRPKESKSLEGENDLSKKDSNLVPTPKNFLNDEYFEDQARGNITIKSGGYLDLKTGIYIHPPEDSEYDAQNDLYYPPVEFGGIDEESGEYVAPPGLILHPLKGFMFTTDVLQKGFHNVTSTLNSGITPVANIVTNVGEKTYSTIKDGATMLRENTGFVGSTVGKGADLVGSGVNVAEDTSSLLLNKTADLLNYTVHDIFLTKIKEVKESVPLVNYLRIKFNQSFDFSHINKDKYNMYDKNIVRQDTVVSETNLNFKVQKNFYTNFFVRPHFALRNLNYIGSNIYLKSFDQITYYVGSDFGYSSSSKEMKYQTFVSIEKGKRRQAQEFQDDFTTQEDSWRFGFSKLILGQKTFATTLDYHYETYESAFDDNGTRHQIEISEIVSITDTRLVKLSVDWNKIFQDRYGATTNWSTKLNFFMTTLKWNMNYDIWGGLRFLSNTGTIAKRDSEENYFLGASLTKTFANSFSVLFKYEILKQDSPDAKFKYLSQNFSSGINYIF